jgi:DNA-directed RNA polymerase subunit beta'
MIAYDHGVVDPHSLIRVRIHGKTEETTVGRLIFNDILPPDFGRFINEVIADKKIKAITAEIHQRFGNRVTAEYVDRLKDLGYSYATKAGVTVGMDDVIVPTEKDRMIEKAFEQVEDIKRQFDRGIITDGERYNKVIDVWQHTASNVSKVMFEKLSKDAEGFNPVFMMRDSGARGSVEQISQLGGMRGLMNKPQKKIIGAVGEIIESPIVASFKEGLSVLEYFISTHGGRKGLADTALKTAEAGYLTRRMVDVAQDVIVTEEDCGTILGIEISSLKEGEEVVEPLYERIAGRTLADDVEDPSTGEILGRAGELLDREMALRIEEAGVESVRIRSVLTCESRRGICAKCYGQNLATGRAVNIGEAVGVIAAQSIGEPGTQLTLRTFHIGGTASSTAEQSETKAKNNGVVRFNENLLSGQVMNQDGKMVSVVRNGEIELLDEQKRQVGRYQVPYGAVVKVNDGDRVKTGQTLYEWDPYNNLILTDRDGKAVFRNIVFREELDEASGHRLPEIIEHRDRSLSPHIEIFDKGGHRVRNYAIPVGAHLFIRDGQELQAGDILVKIPRERRKTRDITGGLPRVAELFEARRPKEPAVVTEIDGVVRFGEVVRGSRELIVMSEDGEERRYLIPYGKHLRVHDGDRVTAGESLSEGAVNPHDILRILGAYKVQEYLVNQIQEVYRLQGVHISDKHIEVIVRQMLQKVKVVDPGDTNFIEGEQVDKWKFADENERVIGEGGDPATFQPVLLGIAKASLMTDSFISAASFQETTRVLTEAAVCGKVDRLLGLKENVIIGHLIPAGTGVDRYRRMSYEALPEAALPVLLEDDEELSGVEVVEEVEERVD